LSPRWFVWAACIALLSGCALSFETNPIVPPGSPTPDAAVIQNIATWPDYSLAGLSGEGKQCDARSAQVVARGWEKRLRRLGLPCTRDSKVEFGVTLKSATPEGIPFTISVAPQVVGPGSPDHQFRAMLHWSAGADAERGQRSLLALEAAKAGNR
jgi:hypothetical protein